MAGAAVAILFVGPFIVGPFHTGDSTDKTTLDESSATSPDALMDAINLHILRTVPSPMEPAIALLPGSAFIDESGGIQ
jgi:hypothetical protein